MKAVALIFVSEYMICINGIFIMCTSYYGINLSRNHGNHFLALTYILRSKNSFISITLRIRAFFSLIKHYIDHDKKQDL